MTNSNPLTALPKPTSTTLEPTPVSTIDPFAFTRGSREADVLVVGEAWGMEEARARLPLVGPSGKELEKMFFDAGIAHHSFLFTNVVDLHPAKNDFTEFLHPTKAKLGTQIRGLHCTPALVDGLAKLEALIAIVKPKLIIGLGNVPMWALTEGRVSIATEKGYKLPGGIMKYRGSLLQTREINGRTYPFLPIVHPAAILRSWDLRFPTVHDLKSRAGRFLRGEMEWQDPDPPGLHAPSFTQARDWLHHLLRDLDSGKQVDLSTDIETWRRSFISCCGFATASSAICIPFFYFNQAAEVVDYFTLTEEVEIWLLIKRVLEHPNVAIIGQNFAYDTQYFRRMYGIDAIVTHDTMVAHHLLWPGTPKSLDYLSSLYCHQHVYWKDESEEWEDGVNHEDLWRYNCKDTWKTYEIAQELKNLLTHFKAWDRYNRQIRQWKSKRLMSLRGVRQDLNLRKDMRRELEQARNIYGTYLLRCMPEECKYAASGKAWFTSPTYTADIFYRQLGIEPVLHKKTKRPTVDASSFETIRKRAPWLSPVIDALDKLRSIDVFISHFLDVKLSSFDNNMRCSFNITGTETFRRSSSSNPFGEGGNLQNIPKGDSD